MKAIKQLYRQLAHKEATSTEIQNHSSYYAQLNDGNSHFELEHFLEDIDDAMQYLPSVETWLGNESWLLTTAKGLYGFYKDLRDDIKKNENLWSYQEYCERLAYFYFNLACYFNRELFEGHKIDVESIKLFLEKCSEMLSKVDYVNDVEDLKNDADNFSSEVNKVYSQLAVQLQQSNKLTTTDNDHFSLVLGNFNQDSLNQLTNSSMKKTLQNIQLLRIINTLEGAITTPRSKIKYRTAIQCLCLAQAYQLAGHAKLSEMYAKIARDIVAEWKNFTPQNVEDKQEKIREIIENELQNGRSNFYDIICLLEDTFCQSIVSTDLVLIENMFLESCTNFWLTEVQDTLTELVEDKHKDLIQEIFNALNSIQYLTDIPKPFCNLECYEILIENINLITREKEKNLLIEFKRECSEQVIAYSNQAKYELKSLEALANFLNKNQFLPAVVEDLKLKQFHNEIISGNELLKNILHLNEDIYDKEFKILKNSIKLLNLEEDLFFIREFRQFIEDYLKPVEFNERKIDNRTVIEIKSRNIRWSNVLDEIEWQISNKPDINEVRFIATDIVLVDRNLENEIWHGKNIVIKTRTLKVHESVTCDVSGKDSSHVYETNAGTDNDGNGKNGEDGHAAESGGNVLILTESIENVTNLTIISNGGKGSKGQDGGDGTNGKDGDGISKARFNKEFPTFNSIWEIITVDKNIQNTMENMKKDSLMFNLEPCNSEGYFMQSKIKEGYEITFCVYKRLNAYLLHKGSYGTSGGDGGEFGLGGEGGYHGKITVKNPGTQELFDVKVIAKDGAKGENGKGGLHGNHGSNGWDMGYTDRLLQSTHYFGTAGSSKCKLEYYSAKQDGSVWCPHKGKYALIKETTLEHQKLKTCEQRKTSRKNNDRKKHARATRMKNISENTVLNYATQGGHSIATEIIKNLQSELENLMHRAIEAIADNQKQEAKITTEVSVQRQVHFSQEKRKKTDEDNSIRMSLEQTIDFSRVAQDLTDPSALLMGWPHLKRLPLNLSQLSKINQAFEALRKAIQTNSYSDTMINIEKVLQQKYFFATLQEISAKITFPYKRIPARLTSEQAERYLIETNEQNKTFFHPQLGRLSQYLFENETKQRTQLIEFCKKEFTMVKCDDFLASIKSFVLHVGNEKKTSDNIKKYYNEYESFHENVIFDVFMRELSHSRNKDIHDLWMRAAEDKSLEEEFEKQIQTDRFLHQLYNRCKMQKIKHYNWGPCFEDKNVQKAYYKHLQKKGLMSRAYWDLLAYTFEVNIRLYVYDQHKKLLLLDEHCTSASDCIHVLSKGDRLIPLKIDANYLELEDRRIYEDRLYGSILREVAQLNTKTDLMNYLVSNKYPVDQEHSEKKVHYAEDKPIMHIAYCFPKKSLEMKNRLEKLKFQFTGQKGILINLSKRFFSEGVHLSYEEMCHFVNTVLSSCVENRREKNTFAWIIAAYSQKEWIDQLILLEIENHFRSRFQLKAQWQKYLSKIENKDILLLFSAKLKQSNSVSMECINDSLHLLSSIPNESVALEDLELSEWPYALKDKYWSEKLRNTFNWQKNDSNLQFASYYTVTMENIFGAYLVKDLLEIIREKTEKPAASVFIDMLSNFYNERWILSEIEINNLRGTKITAWLEKMQQRFNFDDKDRNIHQLVKLIRGNENTSANIIKNLPFLETQVQIISRNDFALNFKKVCDFTLDDVTKWVSAISKKSPNIESDILAVIDRVFHIQKGFNLLDTQKLTVMILLTSKSSTLAQVSTGEGKSPIVVAAAIIKALLGETVDIVTSSSVLAKRDAKLYKDIYSAFKINVGHNCSEEMEHRKDAYSNNQVVYGDLSNYQRDYLLEKFYGENVFGGRQLTNIFIDEVDSMVLDKGNNMLYLSHDLENFDKLESVYIYIHQWINRPTLTLEQVSKVLNPTEIKEAVLVDLYGAIHMEDLAKLGSDLHKSQQEIIWERLVNSGIIKQDGKILIQTVDDLSTGRLNLVLQPGFSSYKDRLHFLLKERIEREKRIHIPNYLRSFVELHLDKWIENAINAKFMQADHDYVVDVDRTGTKPDRNPNIIILDRDMGTDESNSQWDEALHQFIQLKHGCKTSLQTLKAVFISNVSFFKLYDKLYGLTGTMGSRRERDLLKEIHNVDFVTIPTSKIKRFDEYVPIIATNSKEWIENIIISAEQIAKNRSALIICETVDEVNHLRKVFGGRGIKNVHTYTRDYEEFDIAHNAEQGQIIIATNLAGRGTDIKLSNGLRKAGGLHVCLTYLPKNIRIEQQAFGRAGRFGDCGSGQLIILHASGVSNSALKILDLKKKRDSDELHRISEIRIHYETQIIPEEKCFDEFKNQYEQLKRNLLENNASTEIKDILLRSCLDKWAFWLDANGKSIKENNFEGLLSAFISELIMLNNNSGSDAFKNHIQIPYSFNEKVPTSKLYSWVEENPVQMTKLAKYLAQHNEVNDAIHLFNKVIRREPHFCEAAHYYKAFALTKLSNWSKSEFQDELLKAAKLFERHIETATYASSLISNIKQTNNTLIKVDSFEEQKTKVCNIYSLFLESIADILGHPVSAQSFVNLALNIKEDLADVLYDGLLKNGYLRKAKVKNNVTTEELESICYEYSLGVNVLKEFLSSYEGNEINENDFRRDLKNKIDLPAREAFWKQLLKAQVLTNEVKLVVIEDEKLKTFDSQLLKSFDDPKLKKQLLKLNEEELMLYAEIISNQEKNQCIYRKDDFINTIGKKKYQLLKKCGILTKNKKAQFNLDKCGGVKFATNNSIVVEDLINRIGITAADANQILSELVKQDVIVKGNESKYSLRIGFVDIERIKIPFCPLYEDAVKRVLFNCFSYTIGLQMIVKQKKDNKSKLRPILGIKPHQSLIRDLLAMKIITPPTVDTSGKDVNSFLKQLYNTNRSNFEQVHKNDVQCLPITTCPQNDFMKFVVRILERSGSTLETVDDPDGNLQNIEEVIEIASLVEVYNFVLNGLEHIVRIAQTKWTWKMLFNTFIVLLMGIAQITIGVLIEYFSVGLMTHVGSAFISEGISDIFYAMSALKSGNFSWGDYWKQKIEGVALSAASAGLAGWLTIGTKVSRFGLKLFGPSFAIEGEKLMEICGRNLTKIVGCEEITRQVGKRIGQKILNGVTYGAANIGVELIVENCLQTLSDQIGQAILYDMEDKVANHAVMHTLQEVYQGLGREGTKNLLQRLTENAFSEQTSGFYTHLRQLGSVLSQGLAQATKKNNRANTTSAIDNFNFLNEILTFVSKILQIHSKRCILTEFLNDMDNRLMQHLADNADLLDHERQQLDQGFVRIQEEISDQWITSIRTQMTQIVSTEVLIPLLKKEANCLIGIIGKRIKTTYQSYLEIGYNEEFDQIKRKYRKNKEKAVREDKKNLLKNIEDMYGKELLNLAKKTRDPVLFANIIRENIPMDMTCVDASIRVVHTLLNDMGSEIGTLKFVVRSEGGVLREFTSEKDGSNMKCVEIDLQNKPFDISGCEEVPNQSNIELRNNCLFASLCEDIHVLRTIKPSEFRNRVADCIENDVDIHHHLKKGWHRVPIDLGVYGGARRIPKRVEHYQRQVNSDGKFNEDAHLSSRFNNTPEVTALDQGASQSIGTQSQELIEHPSSQDQDRNSGMDNKTIQPAHLVKCHAPKTITFDHEREMNSSDELVHMLDHPHNAHKHNAANTAGTVGENVEKIQYDMFRMTTEINYTKCVDDIFETKIINMRKKSVTVIEEAITKEQFRLTKQGNTVETSQLNALHKLKYAVENIRHYDNRNIYGMEMASNAGESSRNVDMIIANLNDNLNLVRNNEY